MGKLNYNRTAKHLYEEHYINNVESPLNYTVFRLIMERFYGILTEKIIQGGVYKMGHRLGDIRIRKIDYKLRFNKDGKVKNPPIDWKATNELKAKGVNKWVFYESDYYLRWSWCKRHGKCTVPNQSAYSFTPTSDSKYQLGNKRRLAKANQANSLLHLNYEHIKK